MHQVRIPFILQLGDGYTTFGVDDVACTYTDHRFEPSAERLSAQPELVRELQWQLGVELTNEPAYRLLRLRAGQRDNGRQPRLTFDFERTTYFDYIATNLALDRPLADDPTTTLRQKYVRDIATLDPSPLANSLSAMVLLISEPDNALILAERSQQVAVDRGCYQVSAGGAMRLAVDHDEQLQPSPFITIQRELAEEVGVRLPLEAIRLLGFGIDTRTGEPELLSVAHTPLTVAELRRAYRAARHGHTEFSALHAFPFTLDDIIPLLTSEAWCPGDWVCCYLALINRFTISAVEQRLQWEPSRGMTLAPTAVAGPDASPSPSSLNNTFFQWRKRAPLPLRQLYGWARRQLLPHYLWTHPEFEAYRHWLADTATWPLEKLEALQLEHLQALLHHAYQNVPYYREIFESHALHPNDFQSLADLPRLPLLTKADVRTHLPRLIARNVPREKLYYVMTGGTTGTPLGFYHEKDVSRPHEAAFMYRQWAWAGYRFGDRVALLRPYTFTQTDKHGERYFWDYCALDNSLLLSNYLMSQATLPAYVAKLQAFKPQFIQSFPSALFVLARYLLAEGITNIRPQAIFTEFEQLYPAQRSLIEQAFGCPVLAGYGNSERVVDAVECPERNGYHICMEYGVLELTDEAGQPVPPGELGYVTGTGLDTHCMPFIRYQTDDLARFDPQPCECGCALPLLTDLIGRWQHEVVVTRDGRQIPVTTLNTHTAAFDQVQQYQFFQEKAGELVVRVIPRSDYTEIDTANIQAALLAKLHGEMDIHIVFVDEIPRTRRTKHRMLIQKLPLQLDMLTEEVTYAH